MSRTSNRYNYYRTNRINEFNKYENIIYNTVIYARVSVNNGTDSIANQIALAKEYIDNNNELKLTGVYVDNGYSGVNYNRKGYRRMIEDINKEAIACIVVKDISRLSRNFVDISKFLEAESVVKNIRIISINEEYDSKNCTWESLNNIMFKNMINEIYIRDTSRKIRKTKEYLKNIGVYTGVYAPYGYIICNNRGKRVLQVNEESYWVVKIIYGMYLEGRSYTYIADYLYKNKINNKTVYRNTNEVYAKDNIDLQRWSIKSIRDTIERENNRYEYSYIL